MDGMNICVKSSSKEFKTDRALEELGADDLEMLKFICEYGIVTTKFLNVYKERIELTGYGFTSRLKQYKENGLIDSCYMQMPNGERTVNMYALTNGAAAYFKEYFGLEGSICIGVLDSTEQEDVLPLLKKMALNQFLVCSLNIKKYQVVTNKLYDAVIEYDNDPMAYYVKVLRNEDGDIAETIEFINHAKAEISGKGSVILLCEYYGLMVELCQNIKGIEDGIELYFQCDIGALESPGSFRRVLAGTDSYIITSKSRLKS
jgi:hypothetical protein